MSRYRLRPAEYEASQYVGQASYLTDEIDKRRKVVLPLGVTWSVDIHQGNTIHFPIFSAQGGTARVNPGDWIVTDPDGNRELYSDEDFLAKFEVMS